MGRPVRSTRGRAARGAGGPGGGGIRMSETSRLAGGRLARCRAPRRAPHTLRARYNLSFFFTFFCTPPARRPTADDPARVRPGRYSTTISICLTAQAATPTFHCVTVTQTRPSQSHPKWQCVSVARLRRRGAERFVPTPFLWSRVSSASNRSVRSSAPSKIGAHRRVEASHSRALRLIRSPVCSAEGQLERALVVACAAQ